MPLGGLEPATLHTACLAPSRERAITNCATWTLTNLPIHYRDATCKCGTAAVHSIYSHRIFLTIFLKKILPHNPGRKRATKDTVIQRCFHTKHAPTKHTNTKQFIQNTRPRLFCKRTETPGVPRETKRRAAANYGNRSHRCFNGSSADALRRMRWN